MEPLRRRVRAIALIAAYALAMQGLLLAFGPAQAAPFADLCAGNAADDPGHPAGQSHPCAALCAALGHGVAGSLPPELVVAYVRPSAIRTLVPAAEWSVPPPAIRGPQTQRGPPLT
jgi:hypothetical protein